MRIDIVTDTYFPDVNGVAMTLGMLCEGLKQRGHRVHVIRTGEVGDAKSETLVASLSLPGYREVRVGLPGPFRLRKRWVKKRPDAVYVATESPLGSSAIKVASQMGIPVAAGFHTNFHQYMEQYRLGGLQPAAMAYLRRVHSRAGLTMAPTKDVVEMLEGEGFRKVRLLERGVDTQLFHPGRRDPELRAAWGVRAETPVVVMVGRVAAEKNLEFGMHCVRRMKERIPDLECVVVGDGPILDRLRHEYPLVHYAGVRRGEDLARHYASADILLFPSETETFGNVLLEGMASGLVTVSYDYAAAAKHVEHGVDGLKAEKGDGMKFLDMCLESLGWWKAGAGMRERAVEKVKGLGWERVVESFEGHLREAAECASRMTRSRKKRPVRELRTVFLSDIHLGTPDSKVHEVIDFLRHVRCEKLVLNGDIIDGWALRRGGRWRKRHSRFIRTVLKKMEKDDMEVVYLRGNHDDIVDRFLPLVFGRLNFVKEHLHRAADGRQYLVIHGDGFDSVSTNHRWLAGLGAIGYEALLKVNRIYNHFRAWRGKEYYSVSKAIKARVKSALSFIDEYEKQLKEMAKKRGCEGIICGHIHTPEDKVIDGVRYLNSGDWVESLTGIVEHFDGRMELVRYRDFMADLYRQDGMGRAWVEGKKEERQVVVRG